MDAHGDLTDDPTIPDSEQLYRSIHHTQIKPGNSIASSAFKSSTDPNISVDLSSKSTPEETRGRFPGHVGVAQLRTGEVRELTPGVARDPMPANPAHALIIGDPARSVKQRLKVAKDLANICGWAIPPKE